MGIENDKNRIAEIMPSFTIDTGPKKVFVERRRRPNPVRIVRWDPFDNRTANRLFPGYGAGLVRRFCSYNSLEKSLYLDLRPVDGDYIRIRPWEHGLATQCWTRDFGWLDQQIDFCFPLLACGNSYTGVFPGSNHVQCRKPPDAVEKFSSTIPEQVRKAAAPFGVCLMLVLRTLREYPAHLTLVQENPALVYLAGLRFYENECAAACRTAEFSKLLYQKRRSIAEFATGKSTEKTVHLLSKFRLDRYDWNTAGDISRFLDNSELCGAVAAYRVLPEMFFRELETSPEILKLLVFAPDSGMFDNGFDHEAFREALKLCADCRSMGVHLGRDIMHRAAECTTITGLRRLHDNLVREINRPSEEEFLNRIKELHGSIEFPAPPYSGCDNISPITSTIELFREGNVMHHCVATYCESVILGGAFFYRITSPQRATLELVRDGKEWHPGRMKLFANAEPSDETRAIVQKWLEERRREAKLKNLKNGIADFFSFPGRE